MKKIEMVTDPSIQKSGGNEVTGRIEIELRDGRRLKRTATLKTGAEQKWISETELRDKFRDAASRALSSKRVEALWQLLPKLDQLKDIAPNIEPRQAKKVGTPMDEKIQRILPRFYYGNIMPRGDGRVHRGPGYQFYRLVPNDIIEISIVLGLKDYGLDAVESAIQNYWPCVERLAREKVDVIILGGAPISAQLGRARVLQLIKETKERFGITVDAPIESVLAGMKRLGFKTIAVGSRWGKETNRAVARYLEDGGVTVAAITDRGQGAQEAAAMSFEEGLQTALEVGREAARSAPAAEAVFVPGGAAMSLHVIPAVEEEFGKPTFTNLSGEVWNNLVRPGVIAPIQGWGKLLATP